MGNMGNMKKMGEMGKTKTRFTGKPGFKRAALIVLLLVSIMVPLARRPAQAGGYAEGEVLVVLRDDTGASGAAFSSRLSSEAGKSYVRSAASSAGAEAPVTTYGALSAASGKVLALMKSDTNSTEELIANLKKNPDVLNVIPNYRMRVNAVEANDPGYARQWAIEAIRAPEAWEDSTGSGNVYVAVLDTGIDYGHEDLNDNFGEALSRNFTSNSVTPGSDSNYADDNKHGTHVSGTIAAEGNNGLGVAGINWSANIVALKVLDRNGRGYITWQIAALEYLTELLQNNPGLVLPAVNFSLGDWYKETPAEMEKTVYGEAFKALDSLNRAVIAVAAGNEYSEVGAPAPNSAVIGEVIINKGYYCYPASFTGLNNMIVVGATDALGRAASFTNWSSEYVDVVAPGVNIYSTVLRQGYDLLSGTSMSAPHVAGAAALLASGRDGMVLTGSMLKYLICESANPNINPIASARIPGRPNPLAPQNVPDTTASKHGLLDVAAAMEALKRVIAVDGLSIAPASADLNVSQQTQISAAVTPADATLRGVLWKSSAPGIAAVDSNGLITALSAGTAAITATAMADNNISDTVTITVKGISAPSNPNVPGAPGSPGGEGSGGIGSDGGGGGCNSGFSISFTLFILFAFLVRLVRLARCGFWGARRVKR